jgi:hypothetical protein
MIKGSVLAIFCAKKRPASGQLLPWLKDGDRFIGIQCASLTHFYH